MTHPAKRKVVRPQPKSNAKRIRRHEQIAAAKQKRLDDYQQWADANRSYETASSKPRFYRPKPSRRLEVDPDSAYGQQIERLKRFAKQFSQARKIDVRLKLLREMAELKYPTIRPKLQPLIRAEFDENKHKWLKLKGVCAVCDGQPNVRHHIVQIQNGGLNHHSNLLLLCNPCHAEVHPWLKT